MLVDADNVVLVDAVDVDADKGIMGLFSSVQSEKIELQSARVWTKNKKV